MDVLTRLIFFSIVSSQNDVGISSRFLFSSRSSSSRALSEPTGATMTDACERVPFVGISEAARERRTLFRQLLQLVLPEKQLGEARELANLGRQDDDDVVGEVKLAQRRHAANFLRHILDLVVGEIEVLERTQRNDALGNNLEIIGAQVEVTQLRKAREFLGKLSAGRRAA